MRITSSTPTVFDPQTHQLIDFVRSEESTEEALARLAAYGTALTMLPYGDAQRAHEASHTTPPHEIDAAQFEDMLGMMPPLHWHSDGHGESFKLSEMVTGHVASIFVAVDGRYFTFQDQVLTSHADCCARVRASLAYAPHAEPVATR